MIEERVQEQSVAVVGPGAMGLLLGGYLAGAGVAVTLVDHRADRACRLSESGIRIRGVRGEHHVRLPVLADTSELGEQDLVIFCTKAYDTARAAAQHRSMVGPDTLLLTLQNGLGNVEALSALGIGHVLAGTTAQGANLQGRGLVHHAGEGKTVIGDPAGEVGEEVRRAAAVLGRAGLQADLTDQVETALWSKVVINVGINALTALLRVRNGVLLESRAAVALMEAAVHEALAVAGAAGVVLDSEGLPDRVKEVARLTGANRSSMFSDVSTSRQTEIGQINGQVVARGEALGIPTPVNRSLTLLVKATEETYGKRGQV